MTMPGDIALYHEMRVGEDFLATAGMLWAMVHDVAVRFPGSPRELSLDIEGHGEDEYDSDASEVLRFIRAALGPFLGGGQSETLPDVIVVIGENGRPAVLTGDKDCPVRDGAGTVPDRNLGTATVAAIYVRPGGAFATEQEITT